MKHFIPPFLAAIVLTMAGCSNDEPSSSEVKHPTSPTISLSRSETVANDALNSFGIALFNEVAKSQASPNFVFSPTSMSMSVAMIANAADKETEQSIVAAIGADNLGDLNSLSRKLMEFLPDPSHKARLLMANSVWYKQGLTPAESFVKRMAEHYYSDVTGILFDSQGLAKIEKWCRENTGGLHGNPMQNSIDPLVVCLNTLHFEGRWVNKFDAALTKTQTFHGVKSDANIKMMHTALNSLYFERDGWCGITLDYEGDNHMIVITPAADGDIKAIASSISYGDIAAAFRTAELANITLAMPKFSTDLALGCKSELERLGVKVAPSSMENFTGVAAGTDSELYIDFLQRVSISTDEVGTVASAASAGIIGDITAAPTRSVKMTLDRPFIYMIQNSTTGSIIVAGVYAQPE